MRVSWSAIALGTLACIYPLLLWAMLEGYGVRAAAMIGLITLSIAGLRHATRNAKAEDSAPRFGFSSKALPIGMLLLLAVSFLSGDERVLKLLPISTNILLLTVFGLSLRKNSIPTLHEFARAIEGRDLLSAEAAHCRRWTWVWCAFFISNIAVTGALALYGSRFGWALHTSLLSYIAMGAIFAGEYLARLRMKKRIAQGSES